MGLIVYMDDLVVMNVYSKRTEEPRKPSASLNNYSDENVRYASSTSETKGIHSDKQGKTSSYRN